VGLDVPGTGDYDIFTINVDGGGRFNVTDNTTLFDSDPAYSPDGRQKAVETRLAYSASDGNDDEIFTMNLGGGGAVQLTHNNWTDRDPSYSPDGQKIAYMGNDGDTEIFTIDVDGGGSFNVTHNNTFDYQPSWGSSRRSSSLWPEEGVSQRQ
jgi:Tol biopolymer transport system component